jgi:hypothetical protein
MKKNRPHIDMRRQTKRRLSRRRKGGAVENIVFKSGSANALNRNYHDKNLIMRLNETNNNTTRPQNFVIVDTRSTNANHTAKVQRTVERFKTTKKNFKTERKLIRPEVNIKRARIIEKANPETNYYRNSVLDKLFGKITTYNFEYPSYVAPKTYPVPSDRKIKAGKLFDSAEVIGIFKKVSDGNSLKYILDCIKNHDKHSQWFLYSLNDEKSVVALVKFRTSSDNRVEDEFMSERMKNVKLTPEEEEEAALFAKQLMEEYGASSNNANIKPAAKFSDLLNELESKVGECHLTRKEMDWLIREDEQVFHHTPILFKSLNPGDNKHGIAHYDDSITIYE